jgi:hypothetical protein
MVKRSMKPYYHIDHLARRLGVVEKQTYRKNRFLALMSTKLSFIRYFCTPLWLRRRAESRVKLRREEEGAKKGAVIRQFRFVKVNHFQRGLARPWNARAIAERRRQHPGVRRGAKNEDAASGHPRPPYEMINFTHHLGNSQILSKLLKIIYFV